MTPTDTRALRALLAAGTPGEWRAPLYVTRDDARLIVAAVNSLPALLDELEALREVRAAALTLGPKPKLGEGARLRDLRSALARADAPPSTCPLRQKATTP
jgi:hypothetical protein